MRMMRSRNSSKLIFFFVLTILIAEVFSPRPVNTAPPDRESSVYIVKGFSCPHFTQSMQTGFRVVQTSGIYTTLHGVAGCTEIQAEVGQQTFKSLVLSRVDVKDDMALLTSPEISGGIGLTTSSSWTDGQHVTLLGHPLGIELITTPMSLRTPAAKPLKPYLSSAAQQTLSQRKSPDPSITVLRTDGIIVAGDSGSPILDDANNVLGVADGGLLGGTAGLNWAIPFRNITLTSAAGNEDLDRVANLDPSNLFSLNTDVSPRFPITAEQSNGDKELGQGHSMTTQLTLSDNGSLDAVVEIKNTEWLSSFCGRFAIWFSDKAGNIVWHGGPTDSEQWCTYSRAAFWRSSQLRRTWTSNVPPNQLSRIRKISILQTTGEKQPFAWLRENVVKAKDLQQVAPVQ
jgi:hypothetical protein